MSNKVVGNGGAAVAAYDSVSGSNRVSVVNQARFGDVTDVLVEETNLAVATYYYPSSDGMEIFGFNAGLGLTGELTQGTGTITATIEETNATSPSATDWIDSTQKWEGTDGQKGHASITVTAGSVYFNYSRSDDLNKKFRLKIVVGNATNTVKAYLTKKAK